MGLHDIAVRTVSFEFKAKIIAPVGCRATAVCGSGHVELHSGGELCCIVFTVAQLNVVYLHIFSCPLPVSEIVSETHQTTAGGNNRNVISNIVLQTSWVSPPLQSGIAEIFLSDLDAIIFRRVNLHE